MIRHLLWLDIHSDIFITYHSLSYSSGQKYEALLSKSKWKVFAN